MEIKELNVAEFCIRIESMATLLGKNAKENKDCFLRGIWFESSDNLVDYLAALQRCSIAMRHPIAARLLVTENDCLFVL